MSKNLQLRSLISKHCRDQDDFLSKLEPCLASKNFKLTKAMLIRIINGDSLSIDREEAIMECIESVFETKRKNITIWSRFWHWTSNNLRFYLILLIFISAIAFFSASILYNFNDDINKMLNGAGSLASILGVLLVFLKKN